MSDVVLCHNDLLGGNVLYADGWDKVQVRGLFGGVCLPVYAAYTAATIKHTLVVTSSLFVHDTAVALKPKNLVFTQ